MVGCVLGRLEGSFVGASLMLGALLLVGTREGKCEGDVVGVNVEVLVKELDGALESKATLPEAEIDDLDFSFALLLKTTKFKNKPALNTSNNTATNFQDFLSDGVSGPGRSLESLLLPLLFSFFSLFDSFVLDGTFSTIAGVFSEDCTSSFIFVS